MRKRKSLPLTPLELQIMQVLWQLGNATVQQVLDKMSAQKPAYTTVQTMLTILFRKGKVKRRLRGKAYEYEPVVTEKGATGAAVRDVLGRFFGGSAEDLVMNLIETKQLSAEKLERLSRIVAESEKDKR